MPTAAEIAASKEAQSREGFDRTPVTDTGAREADPHQTPLSDPVEPDLGPQSNGDDDGGAPRQQRTERPKPIYMSPSDEMRASIAQRFKRDDEGKVPFNGDPNDPEMLYGKHGRADQDDPVDPDLQPQAQQQQRQEPQPRMITLKVRGQDVTKSETDWLTDAAKVTAADSYMEEGRQILENARQIHRDNRERTPAEPHRPEDRNNTQDDVANIDPSNDPQHPGDDLEAAIEEVRYGTDSKEAARKLDQVITKRADKAADERQIQRLVGQDNTKSAKAMKAFIEANPDLAQDEDSARFLEMKCYDIQREELIKAGIDEAKLPKDGATLAKWHQFQRIHGSPVSNPEQMLEQAKQRLQSFKGVSSQPRPKPAPTTPRVEVNVDRNARRAQLPNQPTRTMVPPAPQRSQQQEGPKDRSSTIMSMRKARGQIVA